MRLNYFFIYIFLVCIFSSCITPKQTNLLQDIEKNYPTQESPEDYKIIPGDQLKLAIYTLEESMKTLFSVYVTTTPLRIGAGDSYEDISNVLNVYSDGTVKIPYLGKISVEGLTIQEAKKVIGERFRAFSPDVTVDIILNNLYFSVLGELGYQRIDMRRQRLNIFQALALSGNPTELGNRKQVYIIRQMPGGATEYKHFDLRTKDIIDSEYYYIQPNDVLYMPRVGTTFFGRITSFNDIFATIGVVTSTVATVITVIKLADKWK